MFELTKLTDKCYFFESPAKIGLIRVGDRDVCLIDSGNDKGAGRKVRQALDEHGFKLTAIYNTHSNADHIGGNRYLSSQTNCHIYARGIERAFTTDPILESSFLYGGFPPSDLRHKFLLAEPSDAEPLTDEVLPEGMEMINLPGHFFDMVGFRVDGVVYLADCLSSRETLEKYRIGFIYDVRAYLETLERVKKMEADFFVPAHAPVTDNIAPLAQLNIDQVHEIAEKITDICKTPVIFDDLLRRLFDDYGLTLNFEQYVLVGSTVRSYLSYLRDLGTLEVDFSGNTLHWNSV